MSGKQEKDEETPLGLACALDGFVDADFVKGTIRKIAEQDVSLQEDSEFVRIYEKFKCTIDRYHEQPHLLDKELPEIVNISVDILTACSPTSDRFHAVCRLLSLVIKTRGYKVVRNLFPHEVADIEKVLDFIAVQNVSESSDWQTHYVLLLWLSILATVPFALERFDGIGDQPTVTERFLDVCRTFVRSKLKCNVIAAYMTGCFLSRPDIHGRYLRPYLDWVAEELATKHETTEEFVRAAILLSVCAIFKTAKREVLHEHSAAALNVALKCAKSPQEFERKLALKLLQRIGLCQLSPNLAPWRYLMQKRLLLGRQPENGDTSGDDCGENGSEVPEDIEQIIDSLLNGLGDRVLIVRWSAAKGMSRIASRLPKSFATEVINSVFTLFEEKDRETMWQGGCMALAEFGRRGVLLPSHLPKVVAVLLEAFVYDEFRGSCSVGSIVRDTACYVAWTLGRSYDPNIVQPFVVQLAGQLLCLACFDREVNVRRAASAAFQECVGRLGNFPNGIDLVRTADYISVGLRSRAFTVVGVKVAEYREYTRCVIEHLVYRKITHWDKSVRDLAALTLKDLVRLDPQFFLDKIYNDLFEFSTCIDLNMRLGALVALGQISLAISELHIDFPKAIAERLLGLAAEYTQRRYFTSSMHNQTLCAFAEMICNLTKARVAVVPQETFELWWSVGERCLDNPEKAIRHQGALAMAAMLSHLVDADECGKRLRKSFDQLVQSSSDCRCGHAQFLGELYTPVIINHTAPLLDSLETATKGEGCQFVEVRKEALVSLGKICCILAQEGKLSEDNVDKLLKCVQSGSEDYSLSTTFFDVGLKVRIAAMFVFRDIAVQLAEKRGLSLMNTDQCRTIVQKIVSQIADAQRASAEVALNVFRTLLEKCPEIIPESEAAREAISSEDDIDMLGSFLRCDTYRQDLIVQLLIAIGAKTEKECTKAQLSALKYLQEIQVTTP